MNAAVRAGLAGLVLAAAHTATAEGLPPCVQPLDVLARPRRVRLRVFQGAGVRDADVHAVLEDVRTVWEPYGVVVTVVDSKRVQTRTLLQANEAQLRSALIEAGIHVEGHLQAQQQPLALSVAVRVVLGPVRAFLAEHAADASADVIDVMLVEQLAAKDAVVRRYFTSMEGLAFSKALAQRLAPGSIELQLHQALKLHRHRPTVFLGMNELKQAQPHTPAHEVGHALGLQHQGVDSNLMAQQRSRSCAPVLSRTQVRQLDATLPEVSAP